MRSLRSEDDSDEDEIERIVERIKPALAGVEPALQGIVLAELFAMWLTGHHVLGDAEATRKLRERLFKAHIGVVSELCGVDAIMTWPQ